MTSKTESGERIPFFGGRGQKSWPQQHPVGCATIIICSMLVTGLITYFGVCAAQQFGNPDDISSVCNITFNGIGTMN